MSNAVMNKVRWGILSTAKINESIIPAIRCAKNCTLVAIASRNDERAKFYAKKWRIPQSFSDYESLISSDLIDAVYISLPNHHHSTWSIKAMQKGKHVLCEKPLSLSSVEIEKIINTSRINKKVIAEVLMYLHYPQTNIIKNNINKGLIGTLRLIRSEFCCVLWGIHIIFV